MGICPCNRTFESDTRQSIVHVPITKNEEPVNYAKPSEKLTVAKLTTVSIAKKYSSQDNLIHLKRNNHSTIQSGFNRGEFSSRLTTNFLHGKKNLRKFLSTSKNLIQIKNPKYGTNLGLPVVKKSKFEPTQQKKSAFERHKNSPEIEINSKGTNEMVDCNNENEPANCVEKEISEESSQENSKISKAQKTFRDHLDKTQEFLIRKVLLSSPIAEGFDDDTLNEIIKSFFCIEIEPDVTIFSEKEDAKELYIVESGVVEITNGHSTNFESDHVLEQESIFGVESLEENAQRNCTATTKSKAVLLGVSGELFRSAQMYIKLKCNNEKVEVIKSILYFKYLDYKYQVELAGELELVEYKNNCIIVQENEPQDRLYIVNKNFVKESMKFKKIKNINEGQVFGQIGLFVDVSSLCTYSADKEGVCLYELKYQSVFNILGENYLNVIVFSIFKNEVLNYEKSSTLFFQDEKELFNIFRFNYYKPGKVVFPKDSKSNKKICLIISGNLLNDKTGKVYATEEALIGDSIIDLKSDLEYNIISEQESLILEAQWGDILKANESNNKKELIETVKQLKKISIFSKLKETQFLRLAKLITIKTYKDGEIISREGEMAEHYYIIKSGKVKVEKEKKFIRELENGGCFGEIPQLTGDIRLFTVISIGNTTCYELTRENLLPFGPEVTQEIKRNEYLNDINIDLHDLYYVKELGIGQFGKVYLTHNGKHFYAIKVVKKKYVFDDERLMQCYLNEKNIMLLIDHPFVVKLVKTLKNDNFLFFLLEYIEGIALRLYLDKRSTREVKDPQIVRFYGGILLCVINYLHKKRILHRDIKPDNCMISKNGYLKLIDFGVAKLLPEDNNMTKTICGTPHYIAPEVIMGQGYSYNSDYWSLGVTMFEIFYGYVPFGANSTDVMDIYYDILKKKFILPYEPEFKEVNSFFSLILSKNLVQRVCDFKLIRSHAFFQKFNFEELETFTMKAPFKPDQYMDKESGKGNIVKSCSVPIMEKIWSVQYFKDESNESSAQQCVKDLIAEF